MASQLNDPIKEFGVASACYLTEPGIFGSLGILSTGRSDLHSEDGCMEMGDKLCSDICI